MKKLYFLMLLAALTLVSMSYAQDTELYNLSKIRNGEKSKRVSSYDRTGGNNDRLEHIGDGEKRVIMDVKGAGIINHIWITIAPSPERLNRNDIILRMYWDGKPYPSVESPIGPFFGQGWNEKYAFVSMPLAASPVTGNGLVSYFAMPFSNGAKIEIENQSGTEIEAFYFNIDYVEMEKLPADLGRFHAWYNRKVTEANPEGENEWGTLGPQGENKTGEKNYLIADIKGKGQYIGVNYYVQSPGPMWYGEGDEMAFIDGEKLPSIVGTGTEDYFNSSWCPKELYAHPYFGYARVNNETGWL
ncbi:MAG TPA: glycoside hydrolase family 172 protein, partial [Bacteroidales bacterium]|nr:glycoside hydrolase family 172 protein [Bacteroidales bacterium]